MGTHARKSDVEMTCWLSAIKNIIPLIDTDNIMLNLEIVGAFQNDQASATISYKKVQRFNAAKH